MGWRAQLLLVGLTALAVLAAAWVYLPDFPAAAKVTAEEGWAWISRRAGR